MSRRCLYISLLVLPCLWVGCNSSRHAIDSTNNTDTLKTEIQRVAHQELRSVEQSVSDSTTVLLPESLKDFPKDSTKIVELGKRKVMDHGSYPEGLTEFKLDSSLLKQAATHGADQAREQLSKEYGLPFEEITIDSATFNSARQKAKAEAEKYILDQTGNTISLDSLSKEELLAQSGQLLEEQIEQTDYFKNLENTLSEQQGILDAQKARMQEYNSQKAIKEKMTSAAREFIQKHASEIQSLQTEMNDLKKVYSKVSDSEDLTTAVKQTSLEEERFGKRLVFGGNFNIGRSDPFSLDLSPLIGYRINTLFTVGISGSYRAQIEQDILSFQNGDQTTYGYSFFAAHKVYRQFFGYLEGENKATISKTENGQFTTWEQGLLGGVGREIIISTKLKLQVLVLYNFLYDNSSSLYNSPVVFKTGIQF